MIRLACLAVILACTFPGRAGADCPASSASGYGGAYSFDYQHTGPTWNEGIFGGHVQHDLIVGNFGATGGGGGGKQSGGVGLGFSDIYQIVGPASAIPVNVHVMVHLTGTLSASMNTYPFIGPYCDAVDANFQVTSGPANAAYNVGSYSAQCTPLAVDHDVTLALQKLPGEAFTVTYSLGIAGSIGGTINGTILFALPPGYTMSSCQGYSSPPTPAQATSWGSLKASYR